MSHDDNAHVKNMLFFRNNYRVSIWITIILITIAFCILAFIFYSRITQATPPYFATTSDGYIIEIKPKK